jgi:predicted CopG family antitoxin
MSVKTIAVETTVYQLLALKKRDGESFTKTIRRLVEADEPSTTCADAVREASAIWGSRPAKDEVDRMESVVRENRKRVDWSVI